MTRMRQVLGIVLGLVLAFALSGDAIVSPARAQKSVQEQFPKNYMPPGRQMFKDYCASCHGADAKGHGPVSAYLNKQPPDLTKLAKEHGGTFPRDYVTTTLRYGINLRAHGTSDMPVWGPIFQEWDDYSEAAVQRRIQLLCDFLESIQEKQRPQ
jgi:mono/diheme cytochrome c family protein